MRQLDHSNESNNTNYIRGKDFCNSLFKKKRKKKTPPVHHIHTYICISSRSPNLFAFSEKMHFFITFGTNSPLLFFRTLISRTHLGACSFGLYFVGRC
jgi:hypothetical protein